MTLIMVDIYLKNILASGLVNPPPKKCNYIVSDYLTLHLTINQLQYLIASKHGLE